jgi:hypothetical protein
MGPPGEFTAAEEAYRYVIEKRSQTLAEVKPGK